MELGRAQQRILRGLLLRPQDGLDRRGMLRAIYAERPDCDELVRTQFSSGYTLKLMSELAEALRHQGLHLLVVEWVRRGGCRSAERWMIVQEELDDDPAVPLAHVVSSPPVEAACERLSRFPRLVVMLLAAAGERGMSGQEMVARVYPHVPSRPLDPINSVQQHVLVAKRALRQHDLAIVSRPRAGTAARRYLVRTR